MVILLAKKKKITLFPPPLSPVRLETKLGDVFPYKLSTTKAPKITFGAIKNFNLVKIKNK